MPSLSAFINSAQISFEPRISMDIRDSKDLDLIINEDTTTKIVEEYNRKLQLLMLRDQLIILTIGYFAVCTLLLLTTKLSGLFIGFISLLGAILAFWGYQKFYLPFFLKRQQQALQDALG